MGLRRLCDRCDKSDDGALWCCPVVRSVCDGANDRANVDCSVRDTRELCGSFRAAGEVGEVGSGRLDLAQCTYIVKHGLYCT